MPDETIRSLAKAERARHCTATDDRPARCRCGSPLWPCRAHVAYSKIIAILDASVEQETSHQHSTGAHRYRLVLDPEGE